MPLRSLLATAACALALTVTTAQAGPEAMTPQEARHLLSRTGFGAAPHEIAALTGLSRETAVTRIVSGLRTTPATPMPAWTAAWPYPQEVWTLGQTTEELFVTNRYLEIEDLAQWWLTEMVTTPSPLTERLVLFWHDHFATSFAQDENPQWMADQNALFRRHAGGNFGALAAEILRDPALLSFLSNTENLAAAPNENLGREYLELFTLGEGRGYTEADVKAAARALTGHGVSAFGAPRHAFVAEDHDHGRKALLGATGRFGAEDLPRLVIAQDAFGPYIVEKLWRHFVSDTPDPQEVTRLSALWRAHDLEMAPLLHALFLTEAFWTEDTRGRLVKAPVPLLVGAVRSLGLAEVPLADLMWAAEDMGQALFFPPNVGGWPEGTSWITDATAMARASVMAEVATFAPDTGGMSGTDGVSMMARRPAAPPIRPSAPRDLRVGQPFAVEAEVGLEEPSTDILLTLFDVSYGGQTFRALTLHLSQGAHEAPDLSLYVGDCAPACLFGAELEVDPQDPWIWLPLADEIEADLDRLPAPARAFLAALTAHLPALVDATRAQRTWQPETAWQEEEARSAGFAEAHDLARAVAAAARGVVGPPRGALVMAPSRPGALGLAGRDRVHTLDDLDAYAEAVSEQPRTVSATVTYADAQAWTAALPPGITPEEALIAPPLDTLPTAAQDRTVEALLRAPAFQLY